MTLPPPPHPGWPWLRRLASIRWLRAAVLSPVVVVPGFGLATLSGLIWGGVLSRFRVRREAGLFVAPHLPRWAFGRGGTTIGAVYLTKTNLSPTVLQHEKVHRDQWRRYGLAFLPLYFEAGQNALTNRFEIEAGLELGGYTPPRRRPGARP